MDIVKDGYFILFVLHKYICVIRTFSLSGQAPAPSSSKKRGSSEIIDTTQNFWSARLGFVKLFEIYSDRERI